MKTAIRSVGPHLLPGRARQAQQILELPNVAYQCHHDQCPDLCYQLLIHALFVCKALPKLDLCFNENGRA
jgi:hypothetical protein